jgi:hypothetical protein
VGSSARRTRERARFAAALVVSSLVAFLCFALAARVGASPNPATRSVAFARARAAIIHNAPPGAHPEIGHCSRSREWTACRVHESRTLTDEAGISYPITLSFIECVGERAHRLVFQTRDATMRLPSAVS